MLLYHPTWLAVNGVAPGRVRKTDPGLPLATRVPRETAERHVSASAPKESPPPNTAGGAQGNPYYRPERSDERPRRKQAPN